MKFEFLWTDYCLFFLVLIAIVGFYRGFKQQIFRRACHQILRRRLATVSVIILSIFIAIGLLDSIHFKQATEVNGKTHYSTKLFSVLDKLLAPVGMQQEKTYSAPFALHAYSKETRIIDGVPKQVYPRLKYVPENIKSDKQRDINIMILSLHSVVKSILIFGLFYGCWLIAYRFFKKRAISDSIKRSLQNKTLLTTFFTILICTVIITWCYDLSRSYHILGTGKIGQDIFYYTVKSIRTGLVIGTLTTLFMLPFALLLGMAAGFFGGIIDDIIQYIYTTLSSIPGVLLIAASVLSIQIYIANHPADFPTLALRADVRLLSLCMILGVTSWTSLCRLLRAETLKLREIDYIQAARALGTSHFKIIRLHLLPNVMHIVIIAIVLDFSFLVLAEAVLSYVGVGVSPMTISWGNMINGARLELARTPIVWWPILSAFSLMFILVLASNLFADAVRDAFDPRNTTA